VVGSIDLDADNGNIRKINYTYSNPNSSADNTATYYGEVIIENKGFGSSSIGKIKKTFNTGKDDIQMLGLQIEERVLDTNNNTKRKTTNSWENHFKTIYNTSSKSVGLSHYISLNSKKEQLFINTDSLENLTYYTYNLKGQLSYTTSSNSKGHIERQSIRYAYEQYSFVRDKNMLTDAYETTTKLNNEIVDIKRNIWQNDSGKIYIKEKWSGPSVSLLRLNNQVTNVDLQGNLLEVNNGKNIFSSSLRAYTDLYEVASIVNAKHQDVVNELDVTYAQLQNLTTSALKGELVKLYDRLPNAMISLTFYDDNGRVTNRINERKEESYLYYDSYGRIDYITDGYGNLLEKKEYNFGN
jgi:YD repeat-containing protein